MTAPFTVTVEDAEVRRVLRELAARIARPRAAMQDIARALGNLAEDAFQTQTSPFGGRWTDLAERTKERREEQGHWPGPLLQVTGGLAASLTHGADATSAWVGASKEYAAIHQFGGLAGMAPGPAGVPARPFLPVSGAGALAPGARAEILDIMRAWLADAI